ncbi:MAG: 2-succinyl-5-enolpyruvyl-6-hydroxy-3-cyclohexene-1-carboxylic-acid synthase [Ichthyobacteriaceae bacterium]|nr:2-succinyl-5-enolpyruvyl-6-hydroxy-3-cyclohexene-1-carboxylic-acid synthase [Ichthyobacteriaceae bacterium]
MNFPKIALAQTIVDLLQQKNINDVVITPGSRNAPLIIGFTENNFFNSYSVADERSAAFFGLGISQQKKNAVALVCTSGSALLNYAPAVAEAFYSEIPLVVISADRPKEWIDQSDGQTIRQENALGNHVLKSVNLKEGDDKNTQWFNQRLINEALNIAIINKGPVHINVPFSEPLYDVVQEKTVEVKNIKIPQTRPQLEVSELEVYADIWNGSTKKMVLVGANSTDNQLNIQLNHLAKDPSVLVFAESTSNISGDFFVNNIDQLISNLSATDIENLKPEVLITIGGMVVSKKIKAFLRNTNTQHWHIENKVEAPDTYQNLSAIFRVDTDMFFSQFFFLKQNKESNYRDTFLNIRDVKKQKHNEFLAKTEFSDLKIYETLISKLPENINLQSANSSVIRYFQLFNIPNSWDMYCNRGTSGIDGSTSTAIGASVFSKKQTILVTGDISFFYDSNAFWNNYIPNNFKVILINNGGGSIFKIIPGPDTTNALGKYFQTKHKLNAKGIALTHGINYLRADNIKGVNKAIEKMLNDNSAPTILEINTSKVENEEVLKQYWEFLNLSLKC